jgi:hypothetical protein
MEQNIKSIDYSALTRKVTSKEVTAALLAKIKKNPVIYVGTVLIAILIATYFMFLIVFLSNSSDPKEQNGYYMSLFMLVIICVLLPILYFGIRRLITRQIKMQAFTTTNGITLLSDVKDPSYAGIIFNEGDTRSIREAYILPQVHNAEIGNYIYYTGSGKNRTAHNYGYIKFSIPRNVPHLLLDAKSNNLFGKLSNLPKLTKDQQLSLEGDFNNYFTLYAPNSYEADALYILTPDVMQTLLDNTKDFDVEIVDNNVFIYSNIPFDLTDSQELQDVLHIVSLLSKDVTEQTDYYADERIGDRSQNIIDQKGIRLKTSKVPLIVTSLIFTAFISFILFADGSIDSGDIFTLTVGLVILIPLTIPVILHKRKK